MDRTATLMPAPLATDDSTILTRRPSGAPVLLEDDLTIEASAEPPVQYPLDDEERNLVDLVEEVLVLEE